MVGGILMNLIFFEHHFSINPAGCPFSESKSSGHLRFSLKGNQQLDISGDREGLLSLARKLIEVAHAEVSGYHKHLYDVGASGLEITPQSLSIILGLDQS